jgi:hypothetical protein
VGVGGVVYCQQLLLDQGRILGCVHVGGVLDFQQVRPAGGNIVELCAWADVCDGGEGLHERWRFGGMGVGRRLRPGVCLGQGDILRRVCVRRIVYGQKLLLGERRIFRRVGMLRILNSQGSRAGQGQGYVFGAVRMGGIGYCKELLLGKGRRIGGMGMFGCIYGKQMFLSKRDCFRRVGMLTVVDHQREFQGECGRFGGVGVGAVGDRQ